MIIISNKIENKITIDAKFNKNTNRILNKLQSFSLNVIDIHFMFEKDNLQIKPRIIFNVQPSLK